MAMCANKINIVNLDFTRTLIYFISVLILVILVLQLILFQLLAKATFLMFNTYIKFFKAAVRNFWRSSGS